MSFLGEENHVGREIDHRGREIDHGGREIDHGVGKSTMESGSRPRGRDIDHRGRQIDNQVEKLAGKCCSWENVLVGGPPEFFFGSGGLLVWLQ